MNEASDVTAVILAGGFGMRLRSVVSDRPKVLALIGERPFLSYHLDQLNEMGIEQVIIATGYLGDMIQLTFGACYKSIQIVYSQETVPLGTGGALKYAEKLFRSEHILVMNGDSYCDTNISKFWRWHLEKKSLASLLLIHISNIGRFCYVETKPDGQITCFHEKTMLNQPGWINAGIYLFSSSLIGSLPENKTISLEKDLFPQWLDKGIYAYKSEGRFIDIGIPEDYARAGDFFSAISHRR